MNRKLTEQHCIEIEIFCNIEITLLIKCADNKI